MGKYIGRREIRKKLEHMFAAIVDYVEFNIDLNDMTWRKEVGAEESFKSITYINFQVTAESENGEEVVAESNFIVPNEYIS
jgi:hypothetical protein